MSDPRDQVKAQMSFMTWLHASDLFHLSHKLALLQHGRGRAKARARQVRHSVHEQSVRDAGTLGTAGKCDIVRKEN